MSPYSAQGLRRLRMWEAQPSRVDLLLGCWARRQFVLDGHSVQRAADSSAKHAPASQPSQSSMKRGEVVPSSSGLSCHRSRVNGHTAGNMTPSIDDVVALSIAGGRSVRGAPQHVGAESRAASLQV